MTTTTTTSRSQVSFQVSVSDTHTTTTHHRRSSSPKSQQPRSLSPKSKQPRSLSPKSHSVNPPQRSREHHSDRPPASQHLNENPGQHYHHSKSFPNHKDSAPIRLSDLRSADIRPGNLRPKDIRPAVPHQYSNMYHPYEMHRDASGRLLPHTGPHGLVHERPPMQHIAPKPPVEHIPGRHLGEPIAPRPPIVDFIRHPHAGPVSNITWTNSFQRPVPLPFAPLPKLRASISASNNGIILTWDYDNPSLPGQSRVECYHLFAHQAKESHVSPPTDMAAWKKIGVVNALPLPMACTLTQFATGNIYHFAVLAVDINGREGPLSNPCTIRLNLNK